MLVLLRLSGNSRVGRNTFQHSSRSNKFVTCSGSPRASLGGVGGSAVRSCANMQFQSVNIHKHTHTHTTTTSPALQQVGEAGPEAHSACERETSVAGSGHEGQRRASVNLHISHGALGGSSAARQASICMRRPSALQRVCVCARVCVFPQQLPTQTHTHTM